MKQWIVLLIVVGAVTYFATTTVSDYFRATTLTAELAEQKVIALYGGNSPSTVLQGDSYIISFKREDGIYEAAVHKNGVIRSLTKVTALTPPAQSPVEQLAPSLLLTYSEAEKIALEQIGGEIEELQLIETDDGGYYLIEVENNDEEVTIQLHAVTGAILSISYDD